MKTIRTFYILGLLALAACAVPGQTVTSTYDEDYRLSRLSTFAFDARKRDASDPLATDTLTEKKIKDALEEELQRNGYHPPAESVPVDFIVSFRVAIKDRLSEPAGKDYVQGSLIVDFYDLETRNLVWRGIATGMAGRESVDLKLVGEQMEKAAKLLLEQFVKDRASAIGFWERVECECEKWPLVRGKSVLCAVSKIVKEV